MPILPGSINADEKTWQETFYSTLFGDNYLENGELVIDRNTDGYTKGILFEHKQNITNYGESKALGQALIYLSRFNRDGIPVPARICLISQEEGVCHVYNSIDYYDPYIRNIVKYANLKASEGIPELIAKNAALKIKFDITSAKGMKELLDFIEDEKQKENIPVDIDVHNVYGWSQYFYDNSESYGQKPKSDELKNGIWKEWFFRELSNPEKTLKGIVNPWKGELSDFRYIMDILNDPESQRKLGAFYTPKEYAKISASMVHEAIKLIKEKYPDNDYVIIDNCAGTGNLEMYLENDEIDKDILSHVIISTYELKEWMVLKDRFGDRVRRIIPPKGNSDDELPNFNEYGFLNGANALSFDILNDSEVQKYINKPNCNVIMYINPPYYRPTNTQSQMQGGNKSDLKDEPLKKEMEKFLDEQPDCDKRKKDAILGDSCNIFIWSALEHYLKNDDKNIEKCNSLIVFAPIKYWKLYNLVNKKMIKGFAFNREHFHASAACVICVHWLNDSDNDTTQIKLEAKNINTDKKIVNEGPVIVKKTFPTLSEYYDTNNYEDDDDTGIVCALDGTLSKKDNYEKNGKYNKNIIGYLRTDSHSFESPRLKSSLTRGKIFNNGGFYLREHNFIEKLPLFAASRYPDHFLDWKGIGVIMKSGDGKDTYNAALKNREQYRQEDRELNLFLLRCLFWVCVSHYPHILSIADGNKIYKNQLCFDGDTIAWKKYIELKSKLNYENNNDEIEILNNMNMLLSKIKAQDDDKYIVAEYSPKFTYGLYQIEHEIDITVSIKTKSGKPKTVRKYGEIHKFVENLKDLTKKYYRTYLTKSLFDYQFLK